MSITLDGAPGVSISMPARELGKADPGTLVTRLEHRLHHLEDRKASVLADAGHANREIDQVHESIGKAFPRPPGSLRPGSEPAGSTSNSRR